MPAPSPLRISRDEHGVPHVDAASEAELYRGLGVVHGHDRALAMIVTRLAGRGRMAEHLPGGDELVEIDRTFRRLGLHLGATEEAERLGPDERGLVASYCAGANLALARRMPLELRALGMRAAEPWTPADCVLVSRMAGWVALAQSQGEMEALLVQMVRAGVPRTCLDELFGAGLASLDEELVRRVAPGAPLVPGAVGWSQALPRPVASNNWVLAPSRTRSGRALLASDPHLELRLPAVWCEVAGTWDGRWVVAATMPGIPAFIVGRTDALSWGPTYAFMDAVDSWVEDCREGAVRRVVDGADTWVPTAQRAEEIRRRRGEPVRLTVHETDRGVLDGEPDGGLRLATRWSGAQSGARSLAALADALRARDVPAGMAALGRMEAAFNWVLADAGGSIGYQMSGLMPLRADPGGGLVPLPAWDPETAWQGFAEPEDLPRALDPEEGFLVTANHDLNHLGRRAPINLPMGDSRARRIAEELGARVGWTVEAVRDLQLDLRAHQPEPFLAVLRPLLGDGPNERLLHDWDLRYDAASRGATLFERFYRALIDDVIGGVIGSDAVRHLQAETGIVADFYANLDGVLLREASAWLRGATRAAVYRRVARRALAQPARPWGEEQQVVLRHLLFGGRLPVWAGYDRGPLPLPGGRGTVRQGQIYRSGGRETSFAPSFRLVTDFAEDAAHTALAGGPSDRRTSKWYASGLDDWQAGRLKPLRPR